MIRWAPAPVDLIAEADRTRWTKANPAPRVVGYLIVFRDLRDGGTWTARRLADHLGWTRWSARSMIDRVRAELSAWESVRRPPPNEIPVSYEAAPPTSGHIPPKNSHFPAKNGQVNGMISGSYEAEPASRPATVPPNTRARSTSTTTRTTTEQRDTSLSTLWEEVNSLREGHVPGARKLRLTKERRRTLKARVTEHGEASVLKVWTWVLTSPHPRATFLRGSGFVKPDTLHRPGNFATYLEFAEEGLTPTSTPKTTNDTTASALDAFLKE